MAQTSLPIRDTPRWLYSDDAVVQRHWRIERHLVRARWSILVVWLIVISFIPIISMPGMLAVAVVYGTGNAVLWRLVYGFPRSQRLPRAQRLATGLEWVSASGALVVVADRLALVLPGGLLILVMLTGLRFRLLGVFVGTALASMIAIASLGWHAGIRDDIVRETAVDSAIVWVVLLHVMGLLLGVVIRESNATGRQQALCWEAELLNAERRFEDQRQADLAAFAREQARKETELQETMVRCDLALSELAAQRDNVVADFKAQLAATHAEMATYRRRLNRLSDHEETILRLLPRSGLTYVEIGAHVHLTESSVKTYVQRIGVKLGVTGKITRTAVVAAAFEQGILARSETINAGSADS